MVSERVSASDAGANAPPDADAAVTAAIDAGSPADDAAPLETFDGGARFGEVWIRFERTACLGTCPMYTVLIGPHGEVRFTSRLLAKDHFVDGCASKNIGAAGVAALRSAIAKYGYFSLQNTYAGGPTDAPSTNMSVTLGHKKKTVHHYMAAPVRAVDARRLDAIEDAIDKISGAADFALQAGTLAKCDYSQTPPDQGPL